VGLGRLLDTLHDSKHDADTLVIVTSDVGLSDRGWLSDGDALDEAPLAVPLVLRGPGVVAKSRTNAPSTHVDIGRTTLLGLGLTAPNTFEGVDLRTAPPTSRPLLAALGHRRSLRWLGFILRSDGKHEELCDLSLDSACASDATPSSPLALDLLRRAALKTPAQGAAAVKAEPAYPSAPTLAALRAWGR
jgi:membrane-anchored protein YejM (alkaline phosphatase superfamily)